MEKDDLFAKPRAAADFQFDENVAKVFADMIQRSVPGYSALAQGTTVLAGHYARPDTRIYDLGCSLGGISAAVAAQNPRNQIIAVDKSAAMAGNCRRNCAHLDNVQVICDDITAIDLASASVVIMNLTLQFIEPASRLPLLQAIHKGLVAGGVLLMVEKIAFEPPSQQQMWEQLHWEFKKLMGYSDLEISQKRTALENVLIPENEDSHRHRLQQAGFGAIQTWFRFFNFAGFCAAR